MKIIKKTFALILMLIAFAGLVSAYSLKVNVYDYSTSASLTADKICVDSNCVFNVHNHVFNVGYGSHSISVQENGYNSYSSSVYIQADAIKNVYLVKSSSCPGPSPSPTPTTYNLAVNVYDYSTSASLTADRICIDQGCVYNKHIHIFTVNKGSHSITVIKRDYESYSSSVYVQADTTKNVYLVKKIQEPVCGNGICEAGETPQNCPQDCGQVCTCSDSDKGLKYYTKGTVTLSSCGNAYTDYCINSQTLKEYYCSGNAVASKIYDCPYGCSNGACVSAPVKVCGVEVHDLSLSENPANKGDNVDISAGIKNTGNSADTIAVKFYFGGVEKYFTSRYIKAGSQENVVFHLNNVQKSGTVKIKAISCQNKEDSESGYLNVREVCSCSDTDEGINYNVRGTVISGSCGNAYTDYCINSQTLKEYYCSGNAVASKIYDCPYGCSNGACVSGPHCDPEYLNNYRCDGNWKQREYQKSDCSTEWKNWEYCDYGCSNGGCLSEPVKVCGVEVHDLSLSENPVEVGGSVEIHARIKNAGNKRENILVKFYFRNELKDEKEITLNAGRNKRVKFNLSGVKSSGYVKIEATACNNVKDSEKVRLRIENVVKLGNLRIYVKKGQNCENACRTCNGWLQGAKVKVEGNDVSFSGQKYTDSTGEVDFYNLPIGNYEITASKNRYNTKRVTVDISSNQTTSETIMLGCCESETCTYHDLKIRKVILPQEIHSGDKIFVEVHAKNLGDCAERTVKVRVTAFGQTKSSDYFSLGKNEGKTLTLYFNVPSNANGPYNIKSEVYNKYDLDSITNTITISGVEAILKLEPSTVYVGENIHVYGYIKGKNRANLYLGNKYMKLVRTDSTGYYSTHIKAEKPGIFPVILKDSSFSVSKTLNVLAELWVKSVSFKDLVATGEKFSVCSSIETTKTGYVSVGLYINGIKDQEKTVYVVGSETVCFDTKISKEGKKEIRILAKQGTNEASKSGTIQVIKPKTEVLVVPKHIMIEYGKNGLLKIVVSNSDPVQKKYEISIEKINGTTIDIPVSSAILSQGESKTFYVNINPHTKGQFKSYVTVSSNGNLIKKVPITLYTSQKYFGFWERVRLFFRKLGKNIGTLFGLLSFGLVVIVIVVLLLYVSFFRARPLEPHYK